MKKYFEKENKSIDELRQEYKRLGRNAFIEFLVCVVLFIIFCLFIKRVEDNEYVQTFGPIIGTIIGIVWLIIGPILGMKKTSKFYKGLVTNQYEISKIKDVNLKNIDYYRELPTNKNLLRNYVLAQSAKLINEKTNVIGAFLLKWINEDRISVKENNYWVLCDNTNFEDTNEERLYYLIFNTSSNIINMSELKEYLISEKIELSNWLKSSYLDVISSMLENNEVISHTRIDKNMIPIQELVLNEELVHECYELAGLKKYLEDYTLIGDKEALHVKVLEEYLIYGYLFGIAYDLKNKFEYIYPQFNELIKFNEEDILKAVEINNYGFTKKDKDSIKIINKTLLK